MTGTQKKSPLQHIIWKVEKIKKLWQNTTTITPSRVQNHHLLLDAHNNKIYSEQAIQQVFDTLNAESVRNRPTAENRAARQVMRAMQDSAPSSFKQSLPPTTQNSDCITRIKVEHEDAFMNLNISSTTNLEQLKRQVKSMFELDPEARVLLGQQTSDG